MDTVHHVNTCCFEPHNAALHEVGTHDSMRTDDGNDSLVLPTVASAWHRRVWSLSWPVILSNATVPLVGAVDTAVVGHLRDPAYIGAVAFGSLIFTFFAWVFGFLRMGTTGFVAQALGARDLNEVSATVMRALGLAIALGIGLLLLQQPIRQLLFWFLGGNSDVEALASQVLSDSNLERAGRDDPSRCARGAVWHPTDASGVRHTTRPQRHQCRAGLPVCARF